MVHNSIPGAPTGLDLNTVEMPNLEDYVTVHEAAEQMGFHEISVRRLLRSGSLQGLKVGMMWLVSKVSIKEYIDRTAGMSKNDPRRSH
jgi:excisionase family DNA binding protein